ncbi:DUF4157 domain-containing protein [Streptomyces pharetrae]|uniref:eCIS core domain-containing protein n=1 Tax=Streptomyces pharetrae TaxID=291370 RepID=UPI003664112F
MRTSRSRAEQDGNERTASGPAAGRKASPGGAAVPPPLTADALRAAQRGAGNAAATGMIARRARHAAAPEESDTAGHRHAADEVGSVVRSAGSRLPSALQREMEDRFEGEDFSDVVVHTGAAARRSADAVGAEAYTTNTRHIVFRSTIDKKTLAHELEHVRQQRAGQVAGTDDGSGLRISDPSDRFERSAEHKAEQVMRGGADVQRSVPDTLGAAPRTADALYAVQRMEGFEVEVDKRVKDRRGNKLPGDTNLAKSEKEDFTVVSDSRQLDDGGVYSNVEFVSGAVQVVGSKAEAGPAELDRIVDEIRRVRDDFYAAVNGTPLESATVDLEVLPGGRGVTLSDEGYTEKAGRSGLGDGLFVQYTVGMPLAGVPLMFQHYREEAAPDVAQAAYPRARALFRLQQARPFAEAELARYQSSKGKKRARIDTDSLDGFLQLYYTQVAAMADYLAQDRDAGQIKNLTVFLSRSRLVEAFELLDSDTQDYLRKNSESIVDRLAEFQEETERPGQKLDFLDNGTRELPGLEPVTLETYAKSALTGEPRVSQQRVFGGMNEITPHQVEGSTVIPMEIRSMGSRYKTWDQLKAELRKIARWAQEGHERDLEIHGRGGSRR